MRILLTLIFFFNFIYYGFILCKEIKCVNNKIKNLIQSLKLKGFLNSKIIESVLCSIERNEFVKVNTISEAYLDMPIYIGYGATISAPDMHVYALEKLYENLKNKNKNEKIKILDVGSGSGYLLVAFAKLLDKINLNNYEIYGVDHIEELVKFSIENIKKSNKQYIENNKIKVLIGDGRKGLLEFKPFDFIHVGAKIRPQSLINQLNHNGRLFVPIRENNYNEYINIIDKDKYSDEIKIKKTLSVKYAPLSEKEIQYDKYHSHFDDL